MIGSALTYLTIVSHRASRPRVSRGRLLRSLHASGVAWFATVFSQAMLPYESIVVLDAFCRAAWRMLVSRRHLLDWRPVSRVQQGVWLRARREYRHLSWVCCATAVSTLAGVVATRPGHLLLALPFAAAWIGAPKLVAWLDGALDAPMTPPAPPAARQTDLVTASGAA
jgi:cyclic beta-1,2-glucan synthetase